jgi:hypothetical protein
MAFVTWQFAQDSIYLQALKGYIAKGNELMDHTPSHQTQMAYIGDDTTFSGDPAIDHMNGQVACLKFADADTSVSHNEGLINIYGNLVISVSPGEFNDLDGDPYFYALFIGEPVNKVCLWYDLKKSSTGDADSLNLSSFWQEPVDFGTLSGVKYHKLTRFDVTMEPASIRFLGKVSKKIYSGKSIPGPFSWIQPTGSMPYFTTREMKSGFGDSLGYGGGAGGGAGSWLCYNEYNPEKTRQYGMQAGAISVENQSIQWNKHQIADYIAKHYTVIDATNLSAPPGGFDVYWLKMSVILDWISQKNIPVRTLQQWKGLLYDTLPNRFINSMPNLSVDLDGDNYPDGYDNHNGIASSFIRSDGVPSSGGCSFEIIGNGGIFQVPELGGFEKGTNILTLWTKRMTPDTSYCTVELSFPETGGSQTWEVPITSVSWKKITVMVTIPEEASVLTISAYRQGEPSDTIRISGLGLNSTAFLNTSRYPEQLETANNPFPPINLNNLVIDSLCNPSTVTWNYHGNSSLELEILPGNILKIQKPVSFWTGKDSVYVVGTNLEGIRDSCLVPFRSLEIPFACGKIPIQLFLLDTLANDSILWSSVPYDPSISNPRVYNPVVAPDVTTLYRVLAINPSGNIFRDSVVVPRYPSPQPALGNDTTICLGKFLTLSASGGIHFQWSTGDTTASITVSPVIKTLYSVTVTNQNGCSGRDSIYVSVVAGPVVTLDGVFPSYCKNDSPVTLSGRPFGGTYYGTSGLIGDTFYPVLADPGPNTLMYFFTDQKTGCSDTAIRFVQINPVPVALHQPDTSLCATYQITLHAGYGFDNYLWSNGSTDSTIVVDSAGYGLGLHPIWVHVTKDGCVDTDTALIRFIICPIGLNENDRADLMEVYPNPATDKITILFKSPWKGEGTLQIYDSHGRMISASRALTEMSNEVDLSSFPGGIYLLRIEIEKRMYQFKLILR